jgi:hypothetical protein
LDLRADKGKGKKVSLSYDDQNKISHRFDTIVPGGHGDPFSHIRSDPYICFASKAAMVQKCCFGNLSGKWLTLMN